MDGGFELRLSANPPSTSWLAAVAALRTPGMLSPLYPGLNLTTKLAASVHCGDRPPSPALAPSARPRTPAPPPRPGARYPRSGVLGSKEPQVNQAAFSASFCMSLGS